MRGGDKYQIPGGGGTQETGLPGGLAILVTSKLDSGYASFILLF